MESPPAIVWLLLALGSAIALGGYEVARKSAVEKNAVLVVLLVANLGGLATLLVGALSLAPTPYLAERWGFRLQPLDAGEHLLVVFKSALVTASWICAYFAVKHLPISIAGPLRSLSPIVTVLGAFVLFQEAPSTLQLLGMAVILGGYWGFAWLGRAEGIEFHTDRWVLLLLLGTFIGATSGLYDKHLLQVCRIAPTTLQVWFTVYNVVLQTGLVGLLWWRRRREVPFRFHPTVPLVGALLIVADQLYFRALAQPDALVSVVSLVRRTSVVVSFVVGGLLFRERLLKKKGAFLLVILSGLVLLFGDQLLH